MEKQRATSGFDFKFFLYDEEGKRVAYLDLLRLLADKKCSLQIERFTPLDSLYAQPMHHICISSYFFFYFECVKYFTLTAFRHHYFLIKSMSILTIGQSRPTKGKE